MVTIAALVCDRASRARLRSAIRGQADVAFCDTVPQLVSAVADGAATAVVTEWRDATGSRLDAAVRTLHADYPTVPILVYAPLTPQGARDMLEAARAGATEIVIANFDDVGITLSRRLSTAQAVALGRQVMARVTELVPVSVAALIDYFLRHGRSAPTVAAAARALSLHQKTLALHCAGARCPGPSALACWARLILAAQRLEDPGRTAERAALELGFPSASAFRNMLKRYTGLSPSEVRERGGSLCVVEMFTARLMAARAHAHLTQRQPKGTSH
jgi:AraC-like DNA-binding protein